MKIKKDKRTGTEFGSENLPFEEYNVVNGGFSDKSTEGYSWIHVENSKGIKFMVGGTTLHKLEKAGMISGTATKFDIPTKIQFGVKSWEIIK